MDMSKTNPTKEQTMSQNQLATPSLVWTKDAEGNYHATGTIPATGEIVTYAIIRYGRSGWGVVRDLHYGWGILSFADAKRGVNSDFLWRVGGAA
jgi:hypothetical protein